MTYYELTLLYYVFYMYFVNQNVNLKNFLTLLLGLFPLILLVMLRGNVGTDTAAYSYLFNQIITNNSVVFLEQGFTFFVKALSYVFNDVHLIIISVGALTTALLLWSVKSNTRAQYIFVICVVPIFYLDMTMNGLRYGLSFAFAICAVSKFYNQKHSQSIIWATFSVLSHVSGWAVFALLALTSENKAQFKKWLILGSVITLVLIAQFYYVDIYNIFFANEMLVTKALAEKMIAYKHLKSPNIYSGISTLLLSLILLFILNSYKAKKALLAHQFYLLLAAVIFTFLLAKFSYAGLRMQSIVLFVILLMMQFKPQLNCIMQVEVRRKLPWVGLLGIGFFIKNLIQNHGVGESPFSPWQFNDSILKLIN